MEKDINEWGPISFHMVPHRCLCALAMKLNPKDSDGNDWRGLAGEFGCKNDMINNIEATSADFTLRLFKERGHKMTVGSLYNALRELERFDAIDVLMQYLPKIIKSDKEKSQEDLHNSRISSMDYSLNMNPYISQNFKSRTSTIGVINNSMAANHDMQDGRQHEMQNVSYNLSSGGSVMSSQPVSFVDGLVRGDLGLHSFNTSSMGSVFLPVQPQNMMPNCLVSNYPTIPEQQTPYTGMCNTITLETKRKVEAWLARSHDPAPSLKHKMSHSDETEPPTKIITSHRTQNSPLNLSTRYIRCMPNNHEDERSKQRNKEPTNVSTKVKREKLMQYDTKTKGVSRGRKSDIKMNALSDQGSNNESLAHKLPDELFIKSDPLPEGTEKLTSSIDTGRFSWPLDRRQRSILDNKKPSKQAKDNKEQLQTKIESEPTESSMEDDVDELGHQLKRACSVSMPLFKSHEHSKGSRNIKVFITYSQDNRKHTQRVLNLCDCLRTNKFQPCIDVYEKIAIQQDKYGWLDEKYNEADFVFVVISPQYKLDADRCDAFQHGEELTYHGLHTRYIHRQMFAEYYENPNRIKRFIPLIFQSSGARAEDIPRWLQRATCYNWPRQYKDLFFHITRPENNLKYQNEAVSNKAPCTIAKGHNFRVDRTNVMMVN